MTDDQMASDRALVERTTTRYADGWAVQWYEALCELDIAIVDRALSGAGEGETTR